MHLFSAVLLISTSVNNACKSDALNICVSAEPLSGPLKGATSFRPLFRPAPHRAAAPGADILVLDLSEPSGSIDH